MAMDNTSNNDKMLKELPHLLPEAPVGTLFQIRCFGHIINLVVKAFLSLFDSSAKALKADGDDEKEGDADKLSDDEEDSDEEKSDDEEDPLGAADDDEVIVEDEAAERDAGEWDEIEELCRSLAEVKLLTAEDKIIGRTTVKKVGLSFSEMSDTKSISLAQKARQNVPQQ